MPALSPTMTEGNLSKWLIKKGDTVMIVEAMKTMNHVPSTFDGTIKKVSVEDGQPVEFGQVLVVFE